MKKRLNITIIVFVIQLSFSICLGQNIIAGLTSSNDIYSDIIPDTTFQALAVHLSPYPGGNYSIDIDNDGLFDFKISVSGGGGLGGGSGVCKIIPLSQYATIASHIDTSEGCCPAQYIAQVADIIDVGDTISNLNNIFGGFSYLWSETYGMSMGPFIFDWNNIGEHYIGVKLTIPNDTLYGWIRVEATSTSSWAGGLFTLVIKDYACNKNPSVSVKELKTTFALKVYPNPAKKNITIEIPEAQVENSLAIYNLKGQELIKQESKDSKSQIDISNLTNGIYFVKLVTDKVVMTRKIIIE
jgi:hypothetical protein